MVVQLSSRRHTRRDKCAALRTKEANTCACASVLVFRLSCRGSVVIGLPSLLLLRVRLRLRLRLRLHIYIYIHIHIYIHTYLYIHLHLHLHLYLSIYISIPISIYTYTSRYMYMYVWHCSGVIINRSISPNSSSTTCATCRDECYHHLTDDEAMQR